MPKSGHEYFFFDFIKGPNDSNKTLSVQINNICFVTGHIHLGKSLKVTTESEREPTTNIRRCTFFDGIYLNKSV